MAGVRNCNSNTSTHRHARASALTSRAAGSHPSSNSRQRASSASYGRLTGFTRPTAGRPTDRPHRSLADQSTPTQGTQALSPRPWHAISAPHRPSYQPFRHCIDNKVTCHIRRVVGDCFPSGPLSYLVTLRDRRRRRVEKCRDSIWKQRLEAEVKILHRYAWSVLLNGEVWTISRNASKTAGKRRGFEKDAKHLVHRKEK